MGQANPGSLDALVILVVHARMTYLHQKHPSNKRFQKYTREHELATFDAIHSKKEFSQKLAEADFPLLPMRFFRRSVKGQISLDDDSDGELGNDFYVEGTTPPVPVVEDAADEDVDDGLDADVGVRQPARKKAAPKRKAMVDETIDSTSVGEDLDEDEDDDDE